MPTVPAKRPKREKDPEEILAGLRRMLRAYVRKHVGQDLDELPKVLALRDDLDQWITEAVAELRNGNGEHSWGQIADTLGISRQAAQKRWGHVGGCRRPGGQPAHLR